MSNPIRMFSNDFKKDRHRHKNIVVFYGFVDKKSLIIGINSYSYIFFIAEMHAGSDTDTGEEDVYSDDRDGTLIPLAPGDQQQDIYSAASSSVVPSQQQQASYMAHYNRGRSDAFTSKHALPSANVTAQHLSASNLPHAIRAVTPQHTFLGENIRLHHMVPAMSVTSQQAPQNSVPHAEGFTFAPQLHDQLRMLWQHKFPQLPVPPVWMLLQYQNELMRDSNMMQQMERDRAEQERMDREIQESSKILIQNPFYFQI